MEITLLSRSKKVKQKIKRDHYWYDHINKQMLHGQGSEMRFVYNAEQKRSIPVIVDHDELVDGNDYNEIKKWIQNNRNQYNMYVEDDDGRNVILNVDDNQFDDIVRDLYTHNIVVDY